MYEDPVFKGLALVEREALVRVDMSRDGFASSLLEGKITPNNTPLSEPEGVATTATSINLNLQH